MSAKLIEHNLEGLRGLAAFTVVFGHICFRSGFLDPAYEVSLPGHFLPPGHFSVLIFFCLSGFVIGHTNRNAMVGWNEIRSYLSKRFVRLYPIYLFSILIVLPFAFEPTREGIFLLIRHLTFTNIISGEIYSQNNPLWSLNYEVLYYLLFIPLAFLKLPRGKLIILVLSLALVNAMLHTRFNHALLTSYLLGYVFWLVGLKLSEYNLIKREEQPRSAFLLSIFLLVIALPEFITRSGLPQLFEGIEYASTVPWMFRAIAFSDLLVLPFCAWFILLLTNTGFRGRLFLTYIVYLVPAFIFAYLLIRGKKIEPLTVPVVIYGIALLLLLIRQENAVTRKAVSVIIFTGGISYAVYAIHFPLLLLFSSITWFSGSLLTVLVRFVVFMTLLVGISLLLEKYLQPRIRNFIFRKPVK